MERPSRRSGTGLETLPDVQNGRETIPNKGKWPETLLDVRQWLYTPPEVRNWLGDPLKCPQKVGDSSGGMEVVKRPSRRSGSGQETLPDVRKW